MVVSHLLTVEHLKIQFNYPTRKHVRLRSYVVIIHRMLYITFGCIFAVLTSRMTVTLVISYGGILDSSAPTATTNTAPVWTIHSWTTSRKTRPSLTPAVLRVLHLLLSKVPGSQLKNWTCIYAVMARSFCMLGPMCI